MKKFFKNELINLILLIAVLGGVNKLSAQQDSQYTQYMYNTAIINPAYAGNRGVLNIFGLHRTQWVGLEGAPVTNTIAISSPIGESGLGAGLSFVGDRIGPTETNNISADISYAVPTSDTYKLAIGMKATANQFSLDRNKLNFYNASDINLQSMSQFSPNIGAGVYLYSDKTYMGLSVPNFLKTTKYSDDTNTVFQDKMHFYLIGGHVFGLSPTVQFKPAVLLKAVQGAPLQLDLSGNFMFNEKLVLGAAWRLGAAMSAMAGFQVTPGIYIGYAYDYDTTSLTHYNFGSHELFLRFELFKKNGGIISPRFF